MLNQPSSLVRSLLSGATVALLGDLLARGLSLLVVVLTARYLGPSLYGEYIGVFASLALVASVIGFGLDTWLLREGGRTPNRLIDYAGAVLLAKLLAAALLISSLIVAGNRVELNSLFAVGCVGIIGDGFLNTGFAVLRARRQNLAVAIFQIMLPTSLLLVLFGLLKGAINPLLLIVAQSSISWLVVLILLMRGLYLLNRSGHRIHIDLRVLLMGAWAFVVADLIANIYSQSATLQLRTNADILVVGVFRVAYNTVTMAYIPPALIFSVSLPVLSSLATSEHDYRRILKLWILGSLVYGATAGIVLWVGAPVLIQRLYGADYVASINVVRWLSVAPLLKSCSFVCALIMLSRQRQILRIMLQGVAMLINLALGAWLIPVFGVSGAIQVTLYTEVVILVLYGVGARITWNTIATAFATQNTTGLDQKLVE